MQYYPFLRRVHFHLLVSAALLGLAWVQVEPTAAKVNHRFEVLGVAESAVHALDLLNLAIESLTHRGDDRVLVVRSVVYPVAG